MNNNYFYYTKWSKEDQEYVGLCKEFPSLSWLASTRETALNGIKSVVVNVIKDLKKAKEPIPIPKFQKRQNAKKKDGLSKWASKLKNDVTLDIFHDRRLRDPKSKIAIKILKRVEKQFGKLKPRFYFPVVIQWVIKGCGFGELVFYSEGDKIYCDNEMMSKESAKAILCMLVDKAIFTEVRKPEKKKK